MPAVGMNYYEEFGISPNATADEVRHAHRSLARVLHPDNFQDEHLRDLAELQMKRINAIYAVLSDPDLRRRYDLEGTRPPVETPPGMVPVAAPPRKLPWVVTGAALTACVAAWVQPAKERVVVVELPAQSEASPAPVANRERVQPKRAEALPMRTGLPRVQETTVSVQMPDTRFEEAEPPPPAVESVPSVPSAPPAAVAVAAAQEPAPMPATVLPPPSGLKGRWIFVPAAGTSAKQPYSAEYAELVVDELNETLRGRYRAKYRVSDQALSPNVQFQFEGRPGAGRFSWRGNGGAAGLVRIDLRKENLLAVSWYTTAPGEQAALMSGTAVLVRAEE